MKAIDLFVSCGSAITEKWEPIGRFSIDPQVDFDGSLGPEEYKRHMATEDQHWLKLMFQTANESRCSWGTGMTQIISS